MNQQEFLLQCQPQTGTTEALSQASNTKLVARQQARFHGNRAVPIKRCNGSKVFVIKSIISFPPPPSSLFHSFSLSIVSLSPSSSSPSLPLSLPPSPPSLSHTHTQYPHIMYMYSTCTYTHYQYILYMYMCVYATIASLAISHLVLHYALLLTSNEYSRERERVRERERDSHNSKEHMERGKVKMIRQQRQKQYIQYLL